MILLHGINYSFSGMPDLCYKQDTTHYTVNGANPMKTLQEKNMENLPRVQLTLELCRRKDTWTPAMNFLRRYETGDDFLQRKATGDESLVNHF